MTLEKYSVAGEKQRAEAPCKQLVSQRKKRVGQMVAGFSVPNLPITAGAE